MSAFGGKADMTLCGNPLSRSLSGVKRTCFIAAQRSAFDPKQTWPSVVLWLLNGGKSQKFGVVSHVSQARCRYVRSRGGFGSCPWSQDRRGRLARAGRTRTATEWRSQTRKL